MGIKPRSSSFYHVIIDNKRSGFEMLSPFTSANTQVVVIAVMFDDCPSCDDSEVISLSKPGGARVCGTRSYSCEISNL